MYQTATINRNLIVKHEPVVVKKAAKKMFVNAAVVILCILGLVTAFVAEPMILLFGLAGFCVLASMAFYGAFLMALLTPTQEPKK